MIRYLVINNNSRRTRSTLCTIACGFIAALGGVLLLFGCNDANNSSNGGSGGGDGGNSCQATITGSANDDTLVGDGCVNNIRGLGGNDILNGRAGADTIDGGAGIDTASYANATQPVHVDLSADNGQQSSYFLGYSDGNRNIGGVAASQHIFAELVEDDWELVAYSSRTASKGIWLGQVNTSLNGVVSGAANRFLAIARNPRDNTADVSLGSGARIFNGLDIGTPPTLGSQTYRIAFADASGDWTLIINGVSADSNDTNQSQEGNYFVHSFTSNPSGTITYGMRRTVSGSTVTHNIAQPRFSYNSSQTASSYYVRDGFDPANVEFIWSSSTPSFVNKIRIRLQTTRRILQEGTTERLISIENLIGSPYGDSLVGNNDNNVLQGLGGNDILSANNGNDILIGGADHDKLTGGTGADTYIFDIRSNSGNDRVFESESGNSLLFIVQNPQNNANGLTYSSTNRVFTIPNSRGSVTLNVALSNFRVYVATEENRDSSSDWINITSSF